MKATEFKNITYKVSSQSKWTFDIPPIKDMVNLYIKNTEGKVLNLFSGKNKIDRPNVINNDRYEALEFIKSFPDNYFDLILFDPPYAKHYKSLYNCPEIKNYNNWIWDLKKHMSRTLKVGGYALQIGYETNGIGVLKGMEKEDLLIIAHGGILRDTFCYTEKKVLDGYWERTWKNKNDIRFNEEYIKVKKQIRENLEKSLLDLFLISFK